jgi:hypothetical protein
VVNAGAAGLARITTLRSFLAVVASDGRALLPARERARARAGEPG